VAGIVIDDSDRVLLVRRAARPARGLWSVPGGALEVGESVAQGLARELAEETGLEVEQGPLVEVVERLRQDPEGRIEYHYLILDYLCRPSGGRLRAGSDAAEVLWRPLQDLESLEPLTADTARVIHKAAAMYPSASWRLP
jgi:ADP-ribose pyrophosphatase YjhB (NUDIX family)